MSLLGLVPKSRMVERAGAAPNGPVCAPRAPCADDGCGKGSVARWTASSRPMAARPPR